MTFEYNADCPICLRGLPHGAAACRSRNADRAAT